MPPDEVREIMYNMSFWDNTVHDARFLLYGSMARAIQSNGCVRYTTGNEADGHAHGKEYVVVPVGNTLQPGKIRVIIQALIDFGNVYNTYIGVCPKADYSTTYFGIGINISPTAASFYHSDGTTTKSQAFAGVKFNDVNIYELIIQLASTGTTEACDAILNVNGRTVARIDRWKYTAHMLAAGVIPFIYLSDDSQKIDLYSLTVLRR